MGLGILIESGKSFDDYWLGQLGRARSRCVTGYACVGMRRNGRSGSVMTRRIRLSLTATRVYPQLPLSAGPPIQSGGSFCVIFGLCPNDGRTNGGK